MNDKKLGPDAGGTGTPEQAHIKEPSLPQNATPLPAPRRAEDLTVNQLVWIFAGLSAVGDEYRQNDARETLRKYGITEKEARKLLTQKRKKQKRTTR
jgi:hypothetical protein